MSRLKFEDIDEWTPSSISIVDVPAHPLCKFEVYEDDEEYVKKSIEIKNYEGETMTEEPKVEVTEGFLERLLGRSILKSEEEQETIEKEEQEEDASFAKLEARITKLEQEIAALKKDDSSEVTPGAVTKSEGEGEAEGEVAETSEESEDEAEAEVEEEAEEEEEEILDESEVVSKSIDPDTITIDSTEKTLAERIGRNHKGMTW